MKRPDILAKLDRDTSEYLMREALKHGWKVRRMTPTYFHATHEVRGQLTSLGVNVHNGHLRASRSQVIETTAASDVVVGWLEQGGDA